MSSTPPEAPTEPPTDPGQGPRVSRDEVRDLGRLRRSTTDRKVAGVAGGLGRHLDVDPVILRVALVVLIFFGGAGILAYLACWLLVPEDDGSSPVVPLDERSRTVALVVAGVIAALSMLGDSWGVWGFPWQLVVLGAIALVILTWRKPHGTPAAGAHPYGAHPYGAQPYGAQPYGGPVPGAAPPGTPYPGAPYPYPAHPGHVAGPTAYAGPPAYVPPPPVDPRRRGPLLFWFTAALAVLGLGVLGVVDAAGVTVAEAAYPALVLALCGVMLLVGAFYGRAGGLVLVGLLAAFATAAATVVSETGTRHTVERPLTAAAVEAEYDLGAGEMLLDLSRVGDSEALAGRTVRVEGGVGRLVVVVPAGLPVHATGDVGVGKVILFDEERDGLGVTIQEPAGPDGERLELDAELGVGEIEVRTESEGVLR